MLYLCLREIEAVGLRVAGTCGINNLSLSSSICNAAILCCVKRKLWHGLILPPPSVPCTLSPYCSGDDKYLPFLLCQPALCSSLPCRLTSAACSVTKQNEEALLKTLLPHTQDVLTFTPLFWWIPSTPEATQGGEHVQKMHKLVRKSWQYSYITNPGPALKTVAAWGLPIRKHLCRAELCVRQGIWATPDAWAGRQLVLVASTCKVKEETWWLWKWTGWQAPQRYL